MKRHYEPFVTGVLLETNELKGNCAEMVEASSMMQNWWICPVHGYVKR